MLKVYGFSRVNEVARGHTRDLRVLWALEEMGVPYQIVGMDHPSHALDSASFRAKNPFGQLPVIDDDGEVVTESGAIVLYLARKSGKLMPRELAGEAQVLRWSFSALTTIEVPMLSLWFVNMCGGKGSKPSEALLHWSQQRLGELDGWLAKREFIATDEFTVADILMAHVLGGATNESLWESCANIRAYTQRCLGREAWKRTLASYCERVQAG
jgi:glutathione S-transferase